MTSGHRLWRLAGLAALLQILAGIGFAQITLTRLTPTSVQAGSPTFILKVFGTNIPQGTLIWWTPRNTPRNTTFLLDSVVIGNSEVDAGIAAPLVATAGLIDISLSFETTPASLPLQVTVPVPSEPQVNLTALAFSFTTSARAPDSRAVSVSSTGTPLTVTAQAQVSGTRQWLGVQPAVLTTPGNFAVSVNPAGLAPGTYTGNINLSAGTGPGQQRGVTVKFAVSDPPRVIVPRSVSFKFDSLSPAIQTLTIPFLFRDNIPTAITGINMSVYSQGAPNWLTAQISGSGVALTANSTALGSGFYLSKMDYTMASGETGSTMVLAFKGTPNPAGGAGPYRLTPYCLWIGDTAPPPGIPEILNGVKEFCPGGYVNSSGPTTGDVKVGVDAGSRMFIASLGGLSISPWLAGPPVVVPEFPSTVKDTTEKTYSFIVDRNQLPPGRKSTFVNIEDAPGNSSAPDHAEALITASLGASGPEIHLDTDSVSLSSPAGNTATASQVVPVTFAGGPVSVTAASDSPWLSASIIGNGSANAQLVISANPAGLSPGIRTGRVTLSSAGLVNSPFDVIVTFNVQAPAPAISAAPVSLTFDISAGSSGPPAQNITVSTTPGSLQVSASASVPWISISPASLATPGQFRVTAIPAGLTAGVTYSGSITLSAAGAPTVPVPVQLRVAPAPLITEVVNGGSFLPEGAQNTWMTIKGTNLAPDPGRVWAGGDFVGGKLPIDLDGVRVNINGKPAYVYFISPIQINVLSPAEAATGQVGVEVVRNGVHSNTAFVLTRDLSPAFLQWPEGYVVSVHANGDLSARAGLFPMSTTIPARPGETVQLFGVGFGPTTPPFPAGIPSTVAAITMSPVVVFLNNIQVETSWSGLVPPFAGLYQLNIKVPDQMPDGKFSVVAQVGGRTTQSGAFLAVQR